MKNKPHPRKHQLRWGFSYPIIHFPSFRVRHTAKDFGKSIISFHSFPNKSFVEKIQNAKGSRGESKEGVINAELNPYWDEFLKNDGKVESAA